MLLGRLGGQMLLITLVLFTLSAYHSPTLAGLTAFFAVFPGLLISPVLGALLARPRRARLIGLDYLLAGISLSLLAFLSTRSLPQALLLLIVALASLTNPLSSTGTRSLFPLVAPVPLWERANAIDSATYIISILLGAPLAASLFATLGAPVALAVSALVFVGAAACLVRLREPSVAPPSVSLLHQSWQGLAYVVRHPALRGLKCADGWDAGRRWLEGPLGEKPCDRGQHRVDGLGIGSARSRVPHEQIFRLRASLQSDARSHAHHIDPGRSDTCIRPINHHDPIGCQEEIVGPNVEMN